jgi:hypothetical protein
MNHTLTKKDAEWLNRIHATLETNEVHPKHSTDDFNKLGTLIAKLKGEYDGHTALVVKEGKTIDKVYIRESTAMCIGVAKEIMTEYNATPEQIAEMEKDLLYHGYSECKLGDDNCLRLRDCGK